MRVWFLLAIAALGFASGAERAADTDQFVAAAVAAGQFDRAASRLAVSRANNQDVRIFAEQVLRVQTYLEERLEAAAREGGRKVQPVDLAKLQRQRLQQLRSLSGAEFDRLFIEEQLKANRDAVALFAHFMKNGDSGPVRRFASSALPDLETRLSHVRGLDATPMT
jgi:putative membrane protein